VASTDYVKISSDLPPQVAGINQIVPGMGREIFFHPKAFKIPGYDKILVAHEFGHSKDQLGLMTSLHPGVPWGKPPFVSDYAASCAPEDFAESHADFFIQPDHLKAVAPAKYQAMQQLNQPDAQTQILDHPVLREAGKQLSQIIDKVPGLRNGLELAAALSAPLLLNRGAGQLEEGIRENLPKKQIDGKLNLAKGMAFALIKSHRSGGVGVGSSAPAAEPEN